MGTIFGLLFFAFCFFYFVIYMPYLFIKWAIWGKNILFPDFERLSEKINQSHRPFNTDYAGWYGKFNYYFLFLWTLGELFGIIYLIYRLAH